jgi:hypothetical protein
MRMNECGHGNGLVHGGKMRKRRKQSMHMNADMGMDLDMVKKV